MKQSDNIGELAMALSAFQGEVRDAIKDSKGYGYKYARLDGVLEIVRPLLAKHKLSVVQHCGTEDNKISVETVLMHGSNQWTSSVLSMPAEPSKGMSFAQSVGSVITYARRYALAALLGITQTDEDAAATKITAAQLENINALLVKCSAETRQRVLTKYGIDALSDLLEQHYQQVVSGLEKLINKNNSEPATKTLAQTLKGKENG